MNDFFRRFAHSTSELVGSPWAFMVSVLIVLIWLISGPAFEFSDTWQLIINTGTTIITFLMVFLIQNMQNRDAKAIHLKLDELIRTSKLARNSLVDLESLSDEELTRLQQQFAKLREREANRLNPAGIGQLDDDLDTLQRARELKDADIPDRTHDADG